MKAVLAQKMDTLWGNAVEVKVEAELDNAHTLTMKEMGSLMVGTMMHLCEEVRSENDRWARTGADRPEHAPGTKIEREQARYVEMEQERAENERERAGHGAATE